MQGVFDIDKERGLKLVEISKGVTVSDIQEATGCSFEASLTTFHLCCSPFLNSMCRSLNR